MTELRQSAKRRPAGHRFLARGLRRYRWGSRQRGRKMPGCCPPQTALGAGNVHPLYPQAFESTGLKSRPARSDPAGERANAKTSARAISAWQASVAEQRRRKEWLALGLPHNSSHLIGRLSFGDAVQLAALVGTGQMTWTEINSALDAKIKLAIARQRARPNALAPHEALEEARRTREDEIWACYHAKCDAVFAEDTDAASTDPWSREQLQERERADPRAPAERAGPDARRPGPANGSPRSGIVRGSEVPCGQTHRHRARRPPQAGCKRLRRLAAHGGHHPAPCGVSPRNRSGRIAIS